MQVRVHRPSRRIRLLIAVALAAGSLLLAGCTGRGFDATVLQDYAPADGTQDRTGDIYALDVLVVANDDGAGTLVTGLVNQSGNPQELTGVRVNSSQGEVRATIAGGSVPLPDRSLVKLEDGPKVSLEGPGLSPGYTVQITFEFSDSTPVTLDVPVMPQSEQYSDVTIQS